MVSHIRFFGIGGCTNDPWTESYYWEPRFFLHFYLSFSACSPSDLLDLGHEMATILLAFAPLQNCAPRQGDKKASLQDQSVCQGRMYFSRRFPLTSYGPRLSQLAMTSHKEVLSGFVLYRKQALLAWKKGEGTGGKVGLQSMPQMY